MYRRILVSTDRSAPRSRATLAAIDLASAAARERVSDLIVMVPRGHHVIKGLLLGSQAQSVLLHSALPVPAHR